MTEVAISLQNISKCFRQYEKPLDRLKEILLPGKKHGKEFWALESLSFDIYKGETFGILGRNGAGKSTLLQLICGTLQPTSGTIQVNGRVAALLELGAGFNPEFTGRENVYMNGAILGLSRVEIDARFDDIAAFADIGEFINQPVKTYSSGMYVRLAFASAIHVNPDILIVDEALSVGDMYFQAKCMSRMRQMMNSGVTVLFVSHELSSVKSLCRRGALIEQGQLVAVSDASEVADLYLSMIRKKMNQALQEQVLTEEAIKQSLPLSIGESDFQYSRTKEGTAIAKKLTKAIVSTTEAVVFSNSRRYGEGGAKILDIKLLNHLEEPVDAIEYRQDFSIQASILFEKAFSSFCAGYLINDLKGIELIGTTTVTEKISMPQVQPDEVYVVEFKTKNTLNSGVYTVTFGVELPVMLNEQHIYLDLIEQAIVFQVNPPEDAFDRFWSRTYAPVTVEYSKF